jgi:protein gp37
MAQNSSIEWTDHTFNPWWGCTKISAGCANCYADTTANRYGFKVWGSEAERRFFTDAHWKEPVSWNRQAEFQGKVADVFCGSMCDVMEDRDDLREQRTRLWELIDRTPWLRWLLLTKRPENYPLLLPARWLERVPNNVMLGCTMEDMTNARQRVPSLICLSREGFRTFVSYEPALGPIEWEALAASAHLWWIISGGESGPGCRPNDPKWHRDTRDFCRNHGIAYFFKQWGGLRKKEHGKLLDGREWCEKPSALPPVALGM